MNEAFEWFYRRHIHHMTDYFYSREGSWFLEWTFREQKSWMAPYREAVVSKNGYCLFMALQTQSSFSFIVKCSMAKVKLGLQGQPLIPHGCWSCRFCKGMSSYYLPNEYVLIRALSSKCSILSYRFTMLATDKMTLDPNSYWRHGITW